MNEGAAQLSVTKMSAEVADERIDPDALDGLRVAMQSVELATSLGIPEILPVGCLVASACEAWLFDEGFQQDRAVCVAGVPVVRQASADQGKGARGKVATGYPGKDKESSVVDDEVEVARALFMRPTNELIARFGFPRTRAEAQQRSAAARPA